LDSAGAAASGEEVEGDGAPLDACEAGWYWGEDGGNGLSAMRAVELRRGYPDVVPASGGGAIFARHSRFVVAKV
jgi:hypothetical protein